MNKPLITIVTVCFNAAADIEKTILSVINQTYPNFEYIIIDGGSTDATLEIINKYKNRITKLISESDNGIYDAMNKGIIKASGDWINFMNAGDQFYEINTVNEIFNNPIPEQKLVLYGDACLSLANKLYFRPVSPLSDLVQKIPFCHQSSFVRAEYIKKNMFDLKFKIVSDYNLFHQIYFANKDAFLYFPLIVSIYNTDQGFSIRNALKGFHELAIISNYYKGITLKMKFIFVYLKTYIMSFKVLSSVRETRKKKYINTLTPILDKQSFKY